MLTIKQFARVVGRSTYTVRFWLKNNLLKKRKFAGSLYFTAEDVEKTKQIKKKMRENQIKSMRWRKK